MSGPGQALQTSGGFHGLVIARPAIVIPDRDRDIPIPDPKDSEGGRESLDENGDKGEIKELTGVESNVDSLDKNLKGFDEQSVTLSPREKLAMNEGGSFPTQRKLPIPANLANANTSLKGILIKPKRILPPQPNSVKPTKIGIDSIKLGNDFTKRHQDIPKLGQENAGPVEYKESKDDCVHTGLNSTRVNSVEFNESQPHLSVTKLNINVDRLKTYFATPTKGCPNVNTSLGRQAKSGLCKDNDIKVSANSLDQVRSNTECANTGQNGGFKHGGEEIKTWCSRDLNAITNNMSAEPSVSKSIERNIRSPSPKSNTTWDRSSSGYSSDERADPRSPPPSIQSATNKTYSPQDDVVSMLTETTDRQGTISDKTYSLEPGLGTEPAIKVETPNNDCLVPDICPKTLEQSSLDVNNCDNCDNNNEIKRRGLESATQVLGNDSPALSTNFQTEFQIILKTNSRRPAWTALTNPSASGRIQYRKSGTEPTINLRHPNRQNYQDSFDGLEVCGKSYPQTLIPSSSKNETQQFLEPSRSDSISGNRLEIITPVSAFSVPERTSGATNESGNSGNKLDSSVVEVIRPKVLRQPLSTARNFKDLKTMTLNMNLKQDKDIRKTLQDLNSPRRQSPGGKSVPIRARPDPAISQSINSSFTSIQKPTNSELGKKMWRAPSGLPENAQMRPFSPFGGTLPPAKLKESERKKHMAE